MTFKFRQEDPPSPNTGRGRTSLLGEIQEHLKKNPGKWFVVKETSIRQTAASAAYSWNKVAYPGVRFVSREANKKFCVFGIYEPPATLPKNKK